MNHFIHAILVLLMVTAGAPAQTVEDVTDAARQLEARKDATIQSREQEAAHLRAQLATRPAAPRPAGLSEPAPAPNTNPPPVPTPSLKYGSAPTIRVGSDGDVRTAEEAERQLADGGTILFARGETHDLDDPLWIARQFIRVADYGPADRPVPVLRWSNATREGNNRVIQHVGNELIVENLKFDSVTMVGEGSMPSAVNINGRNATVRRCDKTRRVKRFVELSERQEVFKVDGKMKYPHTYRLCPHCGAAYNGKHVPACPDKRGFPVAAINPVIEDNVITEPCDTYVVYASEGTTDLTIRRNVASDTQYFWRIHGLRGRNNLIEDNHWTFVQTEGKGMRGCRYGDAWRGEDVRLLVRRNIQDGDKSMFIIGPMGSDFEKGRRAVGVTLEDNLFRNLGMFEVTRGVEEVHIRGGEINNRHKTHVFDLSSEVTVFLEDVRTYAQHDPPRNPARLTKRGTVRVRQGVTLNDKPVPPTLPDAEATPAESDEDGDDVQERDQPPNASEGAGAGAGDEL